MTKITTDCLVLKIEEYIDNELDTTLFLLYDNNQETYLVKGKRSNVFGNLKLFHIHFTVIVQVN